MRTSWPSGKVRIISRFHPRRTNGIASIAASWDWNHYLNGISIILLDCFSMAAKKLKAKGSIWVKSGIQNFARWSSIRHDGRQGLGDNPRTRRRTPMGGFRQEKHCWGESRPVRYRNAG